jgi:AraC-like DNA-binding protein
MVKSILEKHSGILNPHAGERKFHLSRHPPAPDLAAWVERYWIVCWDLTGQPPYVQETLPNACINLVLEKGRSRIYGVARGKSARRLEGTGRAFGVKFRPGAFRSFVNWPISRLTGGSIRLRTVFGAEGESLEDEVLSRPDEGQMVEGFESFLRPRLPEADETITLINQVVDRIIEEREITRVEDLVGRFNLSARTLQRLFRQYVGVSPKWVIQCYRLLEVAQQLARGDALDWSRVALDLGYFDQAHFSKDFKAMVGVSPTDYARGLG